MQDIYLRIHLFPTHCTSVGIHFSDRFRANNYSHPQADCLHKGAFDAKTHHHQLCLVNDAL
jgi:hypothetical protein